MKIFVGTWDIQKVEEYDDDELRSIKTPEISIRENGRGSFQFSAYRGVFDGRIKIKEGIKKMFFKWKGDDADHEEGGIGWIELTDENTMKGELTFIYGPDTKFVAKRRTATSK